MSFFSRLIRSSDTEEFEDFFDDERSSRAPAPAGKNAAQAWDAEEASEELQVDVYQTPEAIVIKALIAGVQPSSIDISLTRETVTIRGTREEEREVEDHDYYHRELYWGTFSRTIMLPEEIDPDRAEASEKHGVLVLRLPKINKARETKLKVRSR